MPVYLERKSDVSFEMSVYEPFRVSKTENYDNDIKNITLKINKEIEKMVLKNPRQWLWSHDRWK